MQCWNGVLTSCQRDQGPISKRVTFRQTLINHTQSRRHQYYKTRHFITEITVIHESVCVLYITLQLVPPRLAKMPTLHIQA